MRETASIALARWCARARYPCCRFSPCSVARVTKEAMAVGKVRNYFGAISEDGFDIASTRFKLISPPRYRNSPPSSFLCLSRSLSTYPFPSSFLFLSHPPLDYKDTAPTKHLRYARMVDARGMSRLNNIFYARSRLASERLATEGKNSKFHRSHYRKN